MRLILLILLLLLGTAFSQENNEPKIDTKGNGTLKSISKAIADGNFSEARTFLIDETVSDADLKKLKTVIDKVIIYIESGIIVPSKEGSKQISITLRDSVIFLLEENGKYYLTKGTTSNIPKLLKMAELLSTPEKTIDYFINKAAVGNLKEAATCFVDHKDLNLTEEEAKIFTAILKGIKEKKTTGLYQGKSEKSLVSFKVGEQSISLAKENSDWLFTLHTKRHINEIYSQLQQKSFAKLVPEKFHQTYFLIKNWQWIGIFLILFLGIIAQWIFQTIFKKTVAKKLHVKEEDEPKSNFRSITILSVSLCWYFLFPLLGVDPETVEILTNASAIMAMVSALFVVSRCLDFFKEILLKKAEQTENKIDDVLIPMFHKLIKLATFVIGFVLIASNIGINVASLLAGIGLAGMAIALAAKDTVENLFGSITVLLDKPFEVGDWVVINGVEGTVEQIGLRSSRIRTFYCSQVNVPNSTLIQATVDNYGRRNFRRIKTMLSLTYDTPPDKIEAFCEGIRELIRNHPYTRKDTYQVYFNNFNAASLDVLLYCFLDTSDWAIELREKQRLFLDIIRLAGRLEIEFAFPTQTIHMANPDQLYPAETETNLNQINDAIMAGRQLGSQIVSQSVPEKGSLPKIDFVKGNSYTEGSNKS